MLWKGLMRQRLYQSVLLVLAAAHASASAAPTKEAEAYLANAVALIQKKHINSGSADWRTIRGTAELQISEARTTADTYGAIRAVLAALGEKHSFLVEPRPQVRSPAGPVAGPSPKAPPLPKWRLVAGRFGLVQLPELDTLGGGREDTGPRYTAELKAGLTAMDKGPLCGWIVDLRENGGGNMWPMLLGLDPLLGNRPFGYFVAQQGVIVPWVRTPSGIFPTTAPMADTSPSYC
jgi:hypothetical protein